MGQIWKMLSTAGEYSIWELVIWGIVIILINQVLTRIFSRDPATALKIAEKEKRINDQLENLREQYSEFDVFARSFAHGIMDHSNDIEERRTVLQECILKQYSEADIYPYNSRNKTMIAVRNYKTTLSGMRGAVSEARDLDSMPDFWKKASDLVVARQELVRELRKRR